MSDKRGLVLVCWLPTVLCGCASDANVSYLPEFLEQPAPKVSVEQPPDVASIVRSDIIAIFTAASNPTDVAFSFPIPARYGRWTTCIRASVTRATGRPMGVTDFSHQHRSRPHRATRACG